MWVRQAASAGSCHCPEPSTHTGSSTYGLRCTAASCCCSERLTGGCARCVAVVPDWLHPLSLVPLTTLVIPAAQACHCRLLAAPPYYRINTPPSHFCASVAACSILFSRLRLLLLLLPACTHRAGHDYTCVLVSNSCQEVVQHPPPCCTATAACMVAVLCLVHAFSALCSHTWRWLHSITAYRIKTLACACTFVYLLCCVLNPEPCTGVLCCVPNPEPSTCAVLCCACSGLWLMRCAQWRRRGSCTLRCVRVCVEGGAGCVWVCAHGRNNKQYCM